MYQAIVQVPREYGAPPCAIICIIIIRLLEDAFLNLMLTILHAHWPHVSV